MSDVDGWRGGALQTIYRLQQACHPIPSGYHFKEAELSCFLELMRSGEQRQRRDVDEWDTGVLMRVCIR